MKLEPLKAAILVLALSGCAVTSSQQMLSLASDRAAPDEVTVLQRGVRGEDCSGEVGFYGSYSAAVDAALQKVSGANVLVNARFSRRELPLFRICVMVEGDAGKL